MAVSWADPIRQPNCEFHFKLNSIFNYLYIFQVCVCVCYCIITKTSFQTNVRSNSHNFEYCGYLFKVNIVAYNQQNKYQ